MADVKVFEGKENDITIKIDWDLCTGDSECVDVCPTDVYALNEEGKAEATKVDECIDCYACEDICPEKAIFHSSWSE
ncbi:MAG: ferredoxin family protein [Myxococcota bacterium]|jgi:NAD-dependent dihydropyrimidine dehydrogenase PreA subunit|nr:ferredoxin family protein [Myxococcota bacterium]